MRLSDVVPISTIEAALRRDLSVERIDSTDWRALAARDPISCHGVGGRAWHLAVTSPGSALDPYQLADYFDAQDPALLGAVEEVTGGSALREFGYLQATVQHEGESFVVATSLVAHLSASELFWYDILMANPSAPLARHQRRSPSQEHRGFGLLGEVVSGVEAAARERGCDTIGIIAAHKPLVAIFRRYGFEVENNAAGRMGMNMGISIPMSKAV